MYKEMLKGALRPHPFLQGIIEKAIMQLRAGGGIHDSSCPHPYKVDVSSYLFLK